MEVEEDTTASGPREIKAFHVLREVYGLDTKMLSRFWDRFQLLEMVLVRLPYGEERVCHFLLGEVCFYKATFLYGLRFLVHPFIMELLGHFNIAPRQLMPSSWRIVISCMEIWLAATEGEL